MIVVMKPRSTHEDIGGVVELLDDMGISNCVIESPDRMIIEVLGGNDNVDRTRLEQAPMVDRILDKAEPIQASGRKPDEITREIKLNQTATVGGRKLAVIAGPCSVESKDQVLEIASAARDGGAVALRGGAFKPRTSPYSFQGLGERGLEILALAREKTGLAVVTEVTCCEQVDLVAQYADVLQVGSRNMHQFHLLDTVGRQSKPVLLKRGWSARIDEFLLAAEYIMRAGNPNVILCERGLRTHENYFRNTLALAVVPEIKRRSTLPIIVDPSHGTGHRHLVAPMSRAAVACGTDGLIIEVHRDPDHAWTDARQSISPDEFRQLMERLGPLAAVCDREC